MIDPEEIITIKWTGKTKGYYESLGYICTGINTELNVRLKDLLKDSSAHVTATCDCDNCKNVQKVPYRNYIKAVDSYGGYRCRSCASKDASKQRRANNHVRLFNLFLDKCNEHDCIPITTDEQFTGCDCDVKYICPTHGEITMNMRRIPSGAWCPQCGIEKRAKSQALSPDEVKQFIESKNNNILINPEDYLNTNTKNLKVICGCCHEMFVTSYSSIMNSDGRCSQCGLKASINTHRENSKKYFYAFADICNEMGYTLLSTVDDYKDCYTKLRFICPKHGEQSGSYAKFSTGQRCPVCGKESIGTKLSLSKEEAERRINSVNNNVLLNPDEYLKNSIRNLRILCSCGTEFTTSLVDYEAGANRCWVCSKKESKGELLIREFLEKHHIDFEFQYMFDNCRDVRVLPFDFYLKEYNLIIEFDGQMHYLPIYGEEQLAYTQKHDKIKNEYCQNNGIDLLRIPYWNGGRIPEILTSKLKIKI